MKKANYTIEPYNNPYSVVADKDSTEIEEMIEVKPEKQLKEPRKEPVPAEPTMTVTEDEPWEGTNAGVLADKDSPEAEETIDVKKEKQLEKPATIGWLRPMCILGKPTPPTKPALQKEFLENGNKKIQ